MLLKRSVFYKFTVLSVVCTLAIVLSLSVLVSYYFKDIMMAREGKISTDFVQAQAGKFLVPEDFIFEASGGGQRVKFNYVFKEIAKMPEVVGVKVYDLKGRVLWSDLEELIGKSFPKNDEVRRALKGESVVIIDPIRRIDHADLVRYRHDLQETYVPIKYDGVVRGVVATYRTSTDLQNHLKKGHLIIWLVSITGGLVLYVALFSLFNGAHKTEKELSENLQRSNRDLGIYNRVARTISKSLALDPFVNLALDKVLKVLELDTGAIYILDQSTGDFTLAAERGLPEGASFMAGRERIRPGGDAGRALTGFAPVIRDREDGEKGRSALVPLVSGERALGLLEIRCRGDRELWGTPEQDIEFLRTLGVIIGERLSKSMLFQELKDLNERLETMVEEKTKQVVQMSKLSSLGELMGYIAHQINNPLIGVINFSQVALKRMGPDDPLRGEIETIERAGKECRDVVKRLLAFSRQSDFEFVPTRMEALIDEAVKLMERPLKEKGIAVETRYADGLPEMMLDPTLIRQSIFSMVTNSWEAMPGGGSLTITASHKDGPEAVEVRIADTGPGIDEDVLPNIFDAFYTTKSHKGGMGLGLAMARDIVHRHGGELKVDTAKGVGTTFIMTLPVSPAKYLPKNLAAVEYDA